MVRGVPRGESGFLLSDGRLLGKGCAWPERLQTRLDSVRETGEKPAPTHGADSSGMSLSHS